MIAVITTGPVRRKGNARRMHIGGYINAFRHSIYDPLPPRSRLLSILGCSINFRIDGAPQRSPTSHIAVKFMVHGFRELRLGLQRPLQSRKIGIRCAGQGRYLKAFYSS